MYYNTLTVESGATLDTDGFRVFCRRRCTVNGTIANIAGEGGGSSAANPAPAGTLGGGGAGGGASTSRGGGGGGIVLVVAPVIAGSGVIHADGSNAAGTPGNNAAAGTRGSVSLPGASLGGLEWVSRAPAGAIVAGRVFGMSAAWEGGGGGASMSSSSAGMSGTNMTNSLGGQGGTAGTAGVTTGNGGGGGGAVIAITRYATSVTLRAAGGAATGSGVAGSAGRTFNRVITG